MFTGKKIGIIGSGNMGEILIRGLITAGVVTREDIIASDVLEDRIEHIAATYGVKTTADNVELVREATILIVAVKPQNIAQALGDIAHMITPDHLVISIAAGISTQRISQLFHKDIRVIRVMPNAPASVLEGMSALCPGKHALPEDLERAVSIFQSVGKTVVLRNEDLMDTVTGLSGSGPAFIFLTIEALSDAGVQLGLQRRDASLLAAQTVLGAAKMFLETGAHPGELKDLVATPGGTTFAGLKALEKGNFRATIMEAVEAAAIRSRELGSR